jgi:hypothetical protein
MTVVVTTTFPHDVRRVWFEEARATPVPFPSTPREEEYRWNKDSSSGQYRNDEAVYVPLRDEWIVDESIDAWMCVRGSRFDNVKKYMSVACCWTNEQVSDSTQHHHYSINRMVHDFTGNPSVIDERDSPCIGSITSHQLYVGCQ